MASGGAGAARRRAPVRSTAGTAPPGMGVPGMGALPPVRSTGAPAGRAYAPVPSAWPVRTGCPAGGTGRVSSTGRAGVTAGSAPVSGSAVASSADESPGRDTIGRCRRPASAAARACVPVAVAGEAAGCAAGASVSPPPYQSAYGSSAGATGAAGAFDRERALLDRAGAGLAAGATVSSAEVTGASGSPPPYQAA